MKGTFEESIKLNRSERVQLDKKHKDLKAKKKLIEKFMRLRKERDEFLASRKQANPGLTDDGNIETNNILFLEGLNRITKTWGLQDLYKNFKGYKEVRHVVDKCVAFVEFDSDADATKHFL